VLFGETFKELLVLIAMVIAGVLLTPIAPWAWIVFGALSVIVLISMLTDILRFALTGTWSGFSL
jgi:hypothetical protein